MHSIVRIASVTRPEASLCYIHKIVGGYSINFMPTHLRHPIITLEILRESVTSEGVLVSDTDFNPGNLHISLCLLQLTVRNKTQLGRITNSSSLKPRYGNTLLVFYIGTFSYGNPPYQSVVEGGCETATPVPPRFLGVSAKSEPPFELFPLRHTIESSQVPPSSLDDYSCSLGDRKPRPLPLEEVPGARGGGGGGARASHTDIPSSSDATADHVPAEKVYWSSGDMKYIRVGTGGCAN